MSTPGSNLLRRASRRIKFETIQYYAATGRTLNQARQYVPAFATKPTDIKASVQAVNRARYAAMGLSFEKFYVQVWASIDIIDLQRDTSGDRFIYNGDLYQMANGTTWFQQDGWAQAMAVRIKVAASGPNDIV